MQFCQAKIRVFALLRSNISQKCRPTSSNFGCFESLIFTKFLASQDRFPFFQFFPPLFHGGDFFSVSTTFSSPDVPDVCPTFARRSVPDVPDVCPTLPDVPDVCPTFACCPKNPRGWHSHFLGKIWHLQEMEVFFFEKKPTSQTDVKISSSKHQKTKKGKNRFWRENWRCRTPPPKLGCAPW